MKKYLLVEGNDDAHVMWSLFKKHNVPESFKIVDCKGIDKLLEGISVRLKEEGIVSLGIVMDADSDLNFTWQRATTLFDGLGYQLPAIPDPNGTVVSQNDRPKIGVWAMPNNLLPGMLEDFVQALVPANDALLPIARKTLDDIELAGKRKFKKAHRPKAEIHTWLAWQEDPGTPMGLAITKKYLSSNHQIVHSFLNWVNRLFN